VVILGSTGSIGQSTVDLLLRNRDAFTVEPRIIKKILDAAESGSIGKQKDPGRTEFPGVLAMCGDDGIYALSTRRYGEYSHIWEAIYRFVQVPVVGVPIRE